MKNLYIQDILDAPNNGKHEVTLLCWLRTMRHHGVLLFLDVVDSTGNIQVVVNGSMDKLSRDKVGKIPKESAIAVTGTIHTSPKGTTELWATKLEVVAEYTHQLNPSPRADFPIFDRSYTDHVLQNRSMYLRNPKQANVLSFKSKFVFEIHKYFQHNGYTLIEPPVLTEMLLYDDSTAFDFSYLDNKVWLSQCCTFQLEPAIMAFEKVYSVTPSFRSEHSRSDRHLNEYTHLKVELAWARLEDLRMVAEDIIVSLAKNIAIVAEKELRYQGVSIDMDAFITPFARVTYGEAVEILNQYEPFAYGKSLGKTSLARLTEHFDNRHIWIDYIPRTAEAFPFSLKPDDPNLVMASDLVAPYGFGEIGGIAEKITDKQQLLERMAEKGRSTTYDIERYKSYIELRDSGLPYHGGIGMGIDRIARYFMQLPHVKDVMPYPRLFGRRWNP